MLIGPVLRISRTKVSRSRPASCPGSPVLTQRRHFYHTIAFVYTAVSSAADAEPFRDSDAVLSRFTNLDYDVLIVAQKGKLGYNNPLVKLILNLHCHSLM